MILAGEEEKILVVVGSYEWRQYTAGLIMSISIDGHFKKLHKQEIVASSNVSYRTFTSIHHVAPFIFMASNNFFSTIFRLAPTSGLIHVMQTFSSQTLKDVACFYTKPILTVSTSILHFYAISSHTGSISLFQIKL